ncbi:BTB/POZ and MATH domain-containing protein 2 [Sorghum bicolor]|uniref:BTB/POZ and MATH domain-containing protein 2 n=1 Tax=Sorghum bicolor TaxID=4558 RepID=UPI00081AC225|nr:BTB/POZ and MATH domain-containing protein 2 [Sorghum bicolor]|eukprot:XP_021319853.1 BTB/POZ and MATH domain-containing protein 2 [Sorghum bicolor]
MANNSTSPVNHGQCLSDTWSRCVTGTVTAAHTFELTNFSLLEGSMGIGKYVDSSTFSVGGHDWNIRVYPDGWKEDDDDYVSVFLNLERGAVGVRVKYSMSSLDKHGHVSKVRDDIHTFEWTNGFRGWSKYMDKCKLQPLLDLNNDCFTIRCDLTVNQDPRTEAVASTIVVPQPNLQQHFEHMLKDGRGTDVTFSVAGELFRAHRCVLAARSLVFQAELFGPVKEEATQPIRIDDMEPTIFEALLHFIYTDRCNVGENVAMQHLLVAADRYGLDRLKAICEDKLCHAIDVETVATTITLAEQHQSVQLKDGCLRFIIASRDVLGAVMKTEGFKHLVASCPLVLKEILDKMAGAK